MAKSRKPSLLGQDCLLQGNLYPSLTPGPLGINDGGDPLGWSWLGDTPGLLGVVDHGDPLVAHSLGGMLLAQRVVPSTSPATSAKPQSPDAKLLKAQEDADVVLLAAVAYGEASAGDVYEEMAAIASVVVRQRSRGGHTLQDLLGAGGTFAYAASDGNPRTAAFRKAKPADRIRNAGMASAITAARNALDGDKDFSNGAYFWDGADIKTNLRLPPQGQAQYQVHQARAQHLQDQGNLGRHHDPLADQGQGRQDRRRQGAQVITPTSTNPPPPTAAPSSGSTTPTSSRRRATRNTTERDRGRRHGQEERPRQPGRSSENPARAKRSVIKQTLDSRRWALYS